MSFIGKIIKDRYKIEDEFMKCRFSILYKAIDMKKNKPYIIRAFHEKVKVKTGQQKKACKAQILMEGNLLSYLNHRHLPQVKKTFEEEDGIFLLMEYFDGTPLEKYIKKMREKTDENLIQHFLIQFIRVFSYLHTQTPPIIIGGLSPENILVDSRGRILLTEFGMTRIGHTNITGRTNLRVLADKHYSAPEQLQGDPPDPRNDIYSIGAVHFFIATKEKPIKSLARLKNSDNDKKITLINPNITIDLEEIIEKMMTPQIADRYVGMRILEADFQAKFPMNVEMSVALPNLMQRLVDGDAKSEKIDIDKTIYPFGPDSMTDITPVSAQTPTGEDLEEELGLEAIEEEDEEDKELKKKFEIARLLHKSFWLGSKQDVQGPMMVSTPGSGFLSQYPSIDLNSIRLEREIAQLLPEKASKAIVGIVFAGGEGNEIKIAVKDPSNVYIYDQIAYALGDKYRPLLYRADPNAIELAIEYCYELPAGTMGVTWQEWLEKKKYEYEELDVKQDAVQLSIFGKDEIDGPVIEEANRIIKEAISIGASDIHLETFEKEMAVRYRIDGVLHMMNTYPPEIARAIVKRVKITGNMDIAQERITQGGRISLKIAEQDFDMRVSVIPVAHGESIVMRILNKGAFNYELTDLGFRNDSIEIYKGLLARPHGMILVSGPTGSGKSTTLYASLKEISRPDRKLLTVEDPIEYEMPGILQVQVNLAPREVEKRVTFSRALREFLRQDPDVILVGEIRDPETASISVQASLTGHLLMSTIHTNDAVGIITRLRDMSVAPYLIGSVMIGGVAQRLVRRTCDKCKVEAPITPADKVLFQDQGIRFKTLARGEGCLKCHNVGYKGRMGIYEILTVSPILGEMISASATSEEIRKQAEKEGMKSLLYDALIKAAAGHITMEEVRRVTMS
ncbi:MAG: Flp pilus assembly complex ATPase component TadA [Candidatus Eremiobacteraeota bacterium]|nr:Flp pilus assembly complex ATPase component TadA [Candidatus Eremiobacteraeota bacterium]